MQEKENNQKCIKIYRKKLSINEIKHNIIGFHLKFKYVNKKT